MALSRRSASRQSGHGTGTQRRATATNVNVNLRGDVDEDEGRSTRRVSTEEVDAFTMRLIGRYGSPTGALTHIAGEQLKYRRRAQHAEARATQLEEQLPSDDDVVLSGDDAKAFKALKTGNAAFTLVGLGDKLKELSTLQSKAVQESRVAALKTAAGTKYKPSLLAKLLGDTELSFKTKIAPTADDPDETEEVQVPFVKVGDTLLSLDQWLEQEHKDMLDHLVVPAGDGTESGTRTTSSTSSAIMPKQASVAGKGAQGGKGKEVLAVVDKTMSTHMSPSQRRKESA
jgi:hypothetical protein